MRIPIDLVPLVCGSKRALAFTAAEAAEVEGEREREVAEFEWAAGAAVAQAFESPAARKPPGRRR